MKTIDSLNSHNILNAMYLKKPTYEWYAIYTKVNQEKKIQSLLVEQNIDCYLPLTKSLKQWSDRKKWIEQPLFRCYVFVRVSNIEFFKVLHTYGVVNYVSFGGKPQTIPNLQIENIRTIIKQQEKEVVLTKEHIAKGVKVEVLHGALKGIQGEVVQIRGQSRILIRLEMMGCCLYTNISKNEIKLLNSNKEYSSGLKQAKQSNNISSKMTIQRTAY